MTIARIRNALLALLLGYCAVAAPALADGAVSAGAAPAATAAPTATAAPGATAAPATVAALQVVVSQAAREARAGAVLDVAGCGIDATLAAGVAERGTARAMPVDAPLRTGSVSKLFTAAAIHALASRGVLELDAPATRYLLPGDAAGVPNREATLRQLLMHSGGVPDYYDWRTTLFWDWKQPLTTDRVLREVVRMEPPHAPGAAYAYSNTGYHLAALAAERATQLSFATIVDRDVIAPLGLRGTRYNLVAPGGPIHGYGAPLRPWADTWSWAENTGADSGITATARDLRKLLRELFLPNGALAATGRAMTEPTIDTDAPRRKAGAGAEVRTSQAGERLVGHTGDVAGYLTFAFAVPAWQATLVGHVNASDHEALLLLLGGALRELRAACSGASTRP